MNHGPQESFRAVSLLYVIQLHTTVNTPLNGGYMTGCSCKIHRIVYLAVNYGLVNDNGAIFLF